MIARRWSGIGSSLRYWQPRAVSIYAIAVAVEQGSLSESNLNPAEGTEVGSGDIAAMD